MNHIFNKVVNDNFFAKLSDLFSQMIRKEV